MTAAAAEGPLSSFRSVVNRRVVSRASAEDLGTVAHLIVDHRAGRVDALVVGKGRHARVVEWSELAAFGPDAVIVRDEGALHAPSNDREQQGAAGDRELIGQRVLTDRGNALGQVTDVTFDPATGSLGALQIDDREIPASAMRAYGTFAVIVGTDGTDGWWSGRSAPG
jgi:sporulation protein YlmC with PRC-barrel domain